MKKKIAPELIRKHKKEEVLELARRSKTSVVAHFALFVFVAAVTPMKTDHPAWLWIFGIAIFLLSGLRMVLAAKVPDRFDSAPSFWVMILSVTNHLSGALWGGLSLLIALFYPLEWPFMFTLVIICGLAAGATSSLGPRFSLSRNFTLLIMAPVTVWGFVHGTSLGIGVGVLCLFSMFMFIRMARDNYLWYWDNIENNERVSTQAAAMEEVIHGIHDNAGNLNSASSDLSGYSVTMTDKSGEMLEKLKEIIGYTDKVTSNSDAVAGSMDQATDSFSSIASAAEQMTGTINEIARSAETTRETTASAVSRSEQAVSRMQALEESANAINRISEAISEISEQINLLALNATIEAARAGEHGKGFAVVANEIKELAFQTSGSTDEIKTQIREIQEATRSSSEAISGIKTVVSEAGSGVASIASAVEEQSSATKEVSENISDVSESFSEVNRMLSENNENLRNVSGHISMLESSAGEVLENAAAVKECAGTLTTLSSNLNRLVETREE